MGRRWLHSTDLETDDDGRPLAEQALLRIAGIGITAGEPDSVVVGNTSTVVLAGDTGRRVVVLTNDSDEKMYVAVGAEAVMGKGIVLPANGGRMAVKTFSIAALAFNAICASGGKSLAIHTFDSLS